MQQFHQTMQRGREGGFIRTVGDVGLILSALFWSFVQLRLINVTGVPSTLDEALRVGVSLSLAIGCAVVLPAVLAIVAPFTPAGQLLQEVRRSTWGFAVMLAAGIYLGWYAYGMVTAYWAAALAPELVAATPGLPMQQAILTLILGVVIPALSFSWSSPMAWMAEVQQAQQVKRLRIAQETQISMLRAEAIRAIALVRRGLANATMEERREVAGVLIGMQRAENDAIGAVVGTLKVLADVRDIPGLERAVPDDGEIVQNYDKLVRILERAQLQIEDADDAPAGDVVEGETVREVPVQRPAEASGVRTIRPDTRPDGPPRTAVDRPASGRTVGRPDAYSIAREALPDAWTRADLERVLSIGKSAASARIAAWRGIGLVVELTDPAGRYRWAEE